MWNIAVIDDDEVYRVTEIPRMLRRKFGAANVTIHGAANVADGIALLQDRSRFAKFPHLAIIDMHMPANQEGEMLGAAGIDIHGGVDFVRRVRAMHNACNFLVIFTAWPTLDDAFLCGQQRVDGYLSKSAGQLNACGHHGHVKGGLEELGNLCESLLSSLPH